MIKLIKLIIINQVNNWQFIQIIIKYYINKFIIIQFIIIKVIPYTCIWNKYKCIIIH